MAIKVRAIFPGYFGHYRESGVEFEIPGEKQFSSKWMEKVDSDEAEEPSVKGKPKSKGKAKASLDSEVTTTSDSNVI